MVETVDNGLIGVAPDAAQRGSAGNRNGVIQIVPPCSGVMADQHRRAIPGEVLIKRPPVDDIQLLKSQTDAEGGNAASQEPLEEQEIGALAAWIYRDRRRRGGFIKPMGREVIAANHQKGVDP